MRFFFVKVIALLFFYAPQALGNDNNHTDSYLLNPNGNCGVGYQDIFLVNTDVCPDAFYHKGVNEVDFSPTNKNYCHELILRVYYPSHKALEQPGDEYYAPNLNESNKWMVKKYKLSKKDAVKLDEILKVKTYTTANAEPIDNQKLPIIIFMAGSGQPVQTYNNIISNLVCNGYIVIGVNSLFINGALQLSNGHVVVPPGAYLDVYGRNENLSDLTFVLKNLSEIKYKFDLEKNMDFSKIGLIGHSRGAMSIVNFMKKNKNNKDIKSIVLMDPANMLLQANYPLPKFNIPSMIMWASQFKKEWKGSALLGKNNYEVIVKPKNEKDNFSNHENFSDNSTLQYHPAYQIPIVHKEIMVGEGNGYEISRDINDYILTFLDNHLKKNGHKNFSNKYFFKRGE